MNGFAEKGRMYTYLIYHEKLRQLGYEVGLLNASLSVLESNNAIIVLHYYIFHHTNSFQLIGIC